jgi:hypothetical protein
VVAHLEAFPIVDQHPSVHANSLSADDEAH